ncbi:MULTISPECIES: hypothetical protein [unclassified Bradyrhizobium]|uniref:hypothetical protein n=1 Tax=unclassified Bradyrhizobium TaxID=2631580 RepID=UPI002FF340F9
MRDLATRSFNELIDPRGLRQQMFAGRTTPDLSNKQSDAHVCEIKSEDGVAQILRCLNFQTCNARYQGGDWSKRHMVSGGSGLVGLSVGEADENLGA